MNARYRLASVSNWNVIALTALVLGVCCVIAPPAAFAADAAPAAPVQEEKAVPDPNPAAPPPAAEAPAVAEPKPQDAAPAAESKPNSDAAKKDDKDKEKDKDADKPANAASDSKPKTDADSKPKVEPSTKSETAHDTKRDKVRLAVLTLKSSIPESAGQVGPFGEAQLDLRETIKRLEKAAKDKTVSGLVLDIQSPDIGRGKVEELRGAIERFRASGKKVYATLDSAMPADYLVACACDEIVMPETGELMLPGVHAEAMFYKGLLAKVGIEADFIHIGDFKGAAEPMTRESFSEPVRENMNALIDSLYDEMVTTIVKDRPLSIAQAKEVVDTGLISATRAKELGLIDRVAYPDALRERTGQEVRSRTAGVREELRQEGSRHRFLRPDGLREVDASDDGRQLVVAATARARRSRSCTPSVRSTPAKAKPICSAARSMGSTTIIEALREANDDKQVAAIVLRIDSPGGSALASDLIWHETQVIKKPIVASMGDVAAAADTTSRWAPTRSSPRRARSPARSASSAARWPSAGCTKSSASRPKRSNAARTAACSLRAASSPIRSAKSSRR